MFDARLRPLIDPPLTRIAQALYRTRLSANALTYVGFGVGVTAAGLIALGYPLVGLMLFLFNRLLDGLDGALARLRGPTDYGGYLDIVLDFIVYAAIPLGFAIMAPQENALAACILIVGFVGTGSSFLAYAIAAAKRGISTELRGRKSFYHLGGLTEGTETILFFILICLLPGFFPVLAYGFAVLCGITTATRITAARETFSETRVRNQSEERQ